MYNRYIPQPDGSYRRNAIPDQRQQPQRPAPPPPPPQPPPVPHHQPPRQEPISGFLRQLIPQGFDTGDLIIVLLLLLIAGDSQESRSNALLTLALYFIL
jgi:hypothetical protein